MNTIEQNPRAIFALTTAQPAELGPVAAWRSVAVAGSLHYRYPAYATSSTFTAIRRHARTALACNLLLSRRSERRKRLAFPRPRFASIGS